MSGPRSWGEFVDLLGRWLMVLVGVLSIPALIACAIIGKAAATMHEGLMLGWRS